MDGGRRNVENKLWRLCVRVRYVLEMVMAGRDACWKRGAPELGGGPRRCKMQEGDLAKTMGLSQISGHTGDDEGQPINLDDLCTTR
jgi:hypothetical protein